MNITVKEITEHETEQMYVATLVCEGQEFIYNYGFDRGKSLSKLDLEKAIIEENTEDIKCKLS